MNEDWFELAVIAFILLGIAIAIWRGGMANPEGTGALGRKVNGLSNRMASLSTRVGHLETEVGALTENSATKADVASLEALINARLETLRAEMKGHRELSKQTNVSVSRIEKVLLEKGLGK